MKGRQHIAALLVVLAALTGCKTRQVVEWRTTTDTVRVASVDTLRVTEWRLRVDSVAVRDTTKVHLEGDTKVIERTKLVDRWRIDSTGISALRIKCDSLSKAKATTTVVERERKVNELRWWQRLLMGIGGIAIVGAAAFAAVKWRKR